MNIPEAITNLKARKAELETALAELQRAAAQTQQQINNISLELIRTEGGLLALEQITE